MKRFSIFAWVWMGIFILSGCITVELKDERPIPTLFEIALVTHTPLPGEFQAPATTISPSATSIPTSTPTQMPAPSATPLPSITPSPVATLTSEGVIFLNAACRQGPGLIYPVSAYLQPGETVQVNGLNVEATWWQVQAYEEPSACWVSAQVIHLSAASAERLPVLNAPPTPHIVQASLASPTPTRRTRPPQATGPAATGLPPTGMPTPTSNPYPYPGPLP